METLYGDGHNQRGPSTRYAAMTQDEAKNQIIPLWREWLHSNRSGKLPQDMLLFHAFVKKNHAHLMGFRAGGDKWQTLKSWIEDQY